MTAPVTWLFGVSGDWTNNPADWSGGQAPTSSNDVTIAAAGTYTVTIYTAASANSLLIDSPGATVIDDGTLTLASTLTLQAGTFELAPQGSVVGGTLSSSGGTYVWGGGTLDGVTYEGALDLSGNFWTVNIANGLTATGANGSGPGTISLTGVDDGILFEGNTTFDNATITLGDVSSFGYGIANDDIDGTGSVLTLGPNLTINVEIGYGNFAYLYSAGARNSGDGIVNKGTINVAGNDSALEIAPVSFTNEGTITVASGDTLEIDAPIWSNAGTVAIGAGSALHLGGNFTTAQLAGITNNGGTVYIDGTLTNTGQTLTVGSGSALGNVVLDGTIVGGTIVDQGSGMQFQRGTLDGVTYDGTLDLSAPFSIVSIANGLTATGVNGSGPGTVNLTGFEDGIFFQGNTTFDNATINLGGASGFGDAIFNDDTDDTGSVLTLGPNLTVTANGSKSHLLSAGPDHSGDGIVNEGAIDVEGSGSTLDIAPYNFTNDGTITVAAGDALDIESQSWSNAGTITIDAGGALHLGGSITTSQLGDITNNGGTVYIDGTLDNTGQTLTVGAGSALGNVVLQGTIVGGTIVDQGAGLTFQGGTLDGANVVGLAAPTVAVSGTPHVGYTLTAAASSPESGVTFAYQWQSSVDGVVWTNISGATASTYLLQPADLGNDIRVQTFATDSAGDVSADATSAPIAVDNYAALGVSASSGQLRFDGTNYTLDLGTVLQDGSPLSTSISIASTASAPADLLSGSLTFENGSSFSNGGSGTFSGLGGGQRAAVESITLPTSTPGTFTETFLINSDGSDSAYSAPLPAKTLTVTGTVQHRPAPDLVVTSVSAPTQAIAGQLVEVSWTIENEGDAAAVGPWQNEIDLASDAAGDNPQEVGSLEYDGILAPGQSATFSQLVTMPVSVSGNGWFVVKADPGNQTDPHPGENNHQMVALAPTAVTTTIDWSSLEIALRPPSIDSTDWSLIWDRFVDLMGTTTKSVTIALAEVVTTLKLVGPPPTDNATLLAYALEQATGLFPNATLAATTDLAENGTGLDLSLTRTYSASFLNRNDAGPFGDGWTFTYGISAATDAAGNVYITSPSGTEFFTHQPNGSYTAQPGDTSTLTLSNGAYGLTGADGTVEQFRADGQLGSITDANGSTIDVSYENDGVIRGVTSSNGQSLTFTTNAEGRITSATDNEGQQTTYAYDASGDHLLSITGPDGTTSYSYASSGNAFIQNALTQIVNPDGTQQTFQYDSQGNLSSQSGSAGTGQITYAYPSVGTVVETDASGNATTLTYGADGNLAQVQDGEGNAAVLQYDANGDLTSAVTPGGGAYDFTYDAQGSLTGYTDSLGGSVTATYAPGTDLLTALTDQNGNRTDYSYNAAGDLTGITYDDGSGTSYQYSANGVLTSSTDARGQTTTYGYNSQGLPTQETFSDGTFQAYAYNGQGELISARATDGGITTYAYNSAGDLTSVTSPSGQVESYTYNSAGQELTRTEPDGSVTQYSYNAAGQLAELEDGAGNLITQYTYNAVGQLTGSLDGNGQTTSYAYDADGNVTQILTQAADGTVTSDLTYTYDADGRPVTATSLDGTWSYTYDASSQLTNAVFASTNPSIANQNLTYEYDAAGNRTETIFNGAVNNYTTNGLNQYTASDGTSYDYDSDGNLVSVTQNGVTTTYTYNSQNQLTATSGPKGDFAYRYDALGNVVSSSDNGVVSNYIIDPLAVSTAATGPLAAIAQVYNASGAVTATYDYGNGLAAVINSEGTEYYNTDAEGNVTSLSGGGGDLVDTYDYAPFGVLLASTSGDNNPFKYSGIFGIATEPNGLVNMRLRYYDPATGRFITRDPTGIFGGVNLYDYVNEDPVDLSDPTGERSVGQLVKSGAQIFGAVGEIEGSPAIAFATISFFTAAGLAPVAVLAGTVVGGYFFYQGVKNLFEGSEGVLQSVGPDDGGFQPGSWQDYASAAVDSIPFDKFLGEIPAEIAGEIAGYLKDLILSPNSKPGASLGAPEAGGATATALGDPHFKTFSGLAFDFQGAGEFIATQSTQPGNTFQVQIRTEPLGSSDSAVSVTTEVAVQVGNDRVTFALNRGQVVWVDGAPAAISPTSPVFTLPGGSVTEVSTDEYRVVLDTGEVVTINPLGGAIGLAVTLAPTEGPGSIKGLFGSDSGQANDFQLADGTVLQQPLTQDQLYQQFADAWRVTDATSLLDYGPGQTTATFTNTQYPREALTLADFSPALVSQAAALVAAYGITDPALAANAEFDYLAMGNPSLIADDAALQGTNPAPSTAAVIIQPTPPPPSIGALPAVPSVVESSDGATPVTFYVNLTSTATTDTVVDYNVLGIGLSTFGKDFFTAADFGGALPSGSVTIPAGQTVVPVTIDLPEGALGSAPDKWLMISVSAPGGNLVYSPTAQTEIINNQPEPGTPANSAIELLSSATPLAIENSETLTQSGNTYTLDLGQILDNVVLPPLQFAIANITAPPGDALSSEITALTGTGFQVSGSQPPATIAAGSTFQDLYVQPETTTLGAQSESLTVASEDVNDTGYLADLPDLTLTVEDTVIAPAQATVATPTILFPNVRVRTLESRTITVTNSALQPAANLDVTMTAGPGALASGSVSQLARGASDDADLSAGLATDTAGLQTGMVTLSLFSDLGNGVEVPALPSPTITVSGSVYREAAGAIAPSQAIVHVGDPGTENLVISNTDPADGFSEGLRASLISSSGAISASGGPTGLIAAGSSDSSSLTAGFSTAAAGTDQGSVVVDFQSDGTGTSGLAAVDLGTSDIPVAVTVNNYAQASIEDANGVGTFQQNGNAYTLDLGTIGQGAAAPTIELGVVNGATGPADLLSGDFSITGDSAFANSGFDAFSGLAASGGADTAPTVSLATGTAGSFLETITLDPTGANASGYSGALAPETLTITGTVVAAGNVPPPPAAVPYDFSGDGKSDLLFQSTSATPQIWLMNGTSVISETMLAVPPPQWKIVGSGDFNGDGDADILLLNTINNAPAIWLMNGTSIIGAATLPAPPPSWRIAGIGDFYGTGDADILWQNSDGTPSIWQMNGTSIVSQIALPTPPPQWKIVAAGDFNGDGYTDILWINTINNAPAIWEMNGTSIINSATLAAPPPQWEIVGTGDFTGNGDSDILWLNTISNQASIWEMNGTSVVGAVALPVPPAVWRLIGTSDVTGNGMDDLLWQNTIDGTVTVWEMNGTSIAANVPVGTPGAGWQLNNNDPPLPTVVPPGASGTANGNNGSMHLSAPDAANGAVLGPPTIPNGAADTGSPAPSNGGFGPMFAASLMWPGNPGLGVLTAGAGVGVASQPPLLGGTNDRKPLQLAMGGG
jgi:RHS repeat-associated protein